MKVALIQLSYDGDTEMPAHERREQVAALVREYGDADLVVLPELWAVGAFRPKTWTDRAERLDGPTVTALADVARECGTVVHVGSVIEDAGQGRFFNTAVVLGPDGGIIARYRKIHRFAAAGLEAEILSAGEEVVVVDLPLRDGGSVRTGLSTCYDLRFPELYRALTDAGAELLVVPASWPQARIAAWDRLLPARALENQCALAAVNAVGRDGKTPMGGHSTVLDAWGEPLAAAGQEQEVLVVDIDLAAVAQTRSDLPVLRDRRLGVGHAPE